MARRMITDDRHRVGNRVTNHEHLPPNSRAYREGTPQHLLSQARFVSNSLHALLDELFTADTLGNLRRAQGFIRAAVKEINETGRVPAVTRIGSAIEQMRRFDKIRVSYFTAQLAHLRKTEAYAETNSSEREIVRRPNNPMIRYTRTAWGEQGRPILLIGQTGVGKTFIAQAAGLHACGHGKNVLFMSVPTLLENQALARSTGSYLKFRDKLVKPDILILDDFGMRKFTTMKAQGLCEILEERSMGKSTIITTQLPLDHWQEVLPDPSSPTRSSTGSFTPPFSLRSLARATGRSKLRNLPRRRTGSNLRR